MINNYLTKKFMKKKSLKFFPLSQYNYKTTFK